MKAVLLAAAVFAFGSGTALMTTTAQAAPKGLTSPWAESWNVWERARHPGPTAEQYRKDCRGAGWFLAWPAKASCGDLDKMAAQVAVEEDYSKLSADTGLAANLGAMTTGSQL